MSIAVKKRWVQGTTSRTVTRPAAERRIAWNALRAEVEMIRAIKREYMLRTLNVPGQGTDGQGATP
jgi:hypothetical protein